MVSWAESCSSGRSSQPWKGMLAYVSCSRLTGQNDSILKEILLSAASYDTSLMLSVVQY